MPSTLHGRSGGVWRWVALGVLLLCGAGYWWLEPNTPTLADGLWLAFTTAATVGYGDVGPSTPASRIFSVFVVLQGFGVLTLATAAIDTTWIETEERRIEREVLRDLHHRLGALHEEIATLRAELRQGGKPPSGESSDNTGPHNNKKGPLAMPSSPPFFAPARFDDPDAALAQVQAIYKGSVDHLRSSLQSFVAGNDDGRHVRACYPFVRVRTDTVARADSRLSYGFVAGPGSFETTLTRPDLFARYYREQFRLLIKNHGVSLEVGTSAQPIPVHFSLAEGDHVEGSMGAERRLRLRDLFDLPDLAAMDDGIANGTLESKPGEAQPLSLFTAPRVDYSLHRLRHYTGTVPDHFQNFVLFTNYQFYIDEFIKLGHALMQDPNGAYEAFVEPGNVITRRVGGPAQPGDENGAPPPRLPQMPAYHLVRGDNSGITMVNIGVGPANAKTITDHVAVLRPHAWLMLGHCAGLRNSQQLGDYVLAHAYMREDHVLDEDLPLWVPIPALAEVQLALEQAVAEVTQLSGYDLKKILRTGTVASTDNRNWELLPHPGPERRFSQSRAVALDMESATIAANGFRFRVPYGTLLCVSDKPLHGEIKLPGMANHFYRERVDQHLRIGMRAVELLRQERPGSLHSRKLRSFAEVAFQ